MHLNNQGMQKVQLDNKRYHLPPYSMMITKLGDQGRLAIGVYEAALSIMTSNHCLVKKDDMFMAKLNFDTQMPVARLEKFLEIIFEYGLFDRAFFEKTGYLSSAAIQELYFEIKKGFRYEDNTILTKMMLLPIDTRKKMCIGLKLRAGATNTLMADPYEASVCQLYTGPEYKSLFIDPGVNNDMQVKLSKRAFNRSKK